MLLGFEGYAYSSDFVNNLDSVVWISICTPLCNICQASQEKRSLQVFEKKRKLKILDGTGRYYCWLRTIRDAAPS